MGSRPLDRRRFRDACAAARSPTLLPEGLPQDADWGELIVAQHQALRKAGAPSEAIDADLHSVHFAAVRHHPLDRRHFRDACAVARSRTLLPEHLPPDAHWGQLIVGRLLYPRAAVVDVLSG